jgi:hypothetical protein
MADLVTIALALAGGLVGLLVLGLLLWGLWAKTGRLVSVPFLLSAAVVGLVASLAIPAPVTRQLPSLPTIGGIGRLGWIILLGSAMLIWMVLSAMLGSGSTNPEPVARRVLRRLERLSTTWIAVLGLLATTALSVGIALLGEGGQVAGEFAQLLADVPLIGSNVFAIGTAYVGLGGSIDLPVLGTVGLAGPAPPALVAGLIALSFTLAVGVTYQD